MKRSPHSEHTERSVSNCIACHREDMAELDAKERREAGYRITDRRDLDTYHRVRAERGSRCDNCEEKRYS